jgi:hypothetical protein
MRGTPEQQRAQIERRLVTMRKQIAQRTKTITILEAQLEPYLTLQERAERLTAQSCNCDGTDHTQGFGCS